GGRRGNTHGGVEDPRFGGAILIRVIHVEYRQGQVVGEIQVLHVAGRQDICQAVGNGIAGLDVDRGGESGAAVDGKTKHTGACLRNPAGVKARPSPNHG
ncbi:hypothetical protein CVH13_01104, partial [Dehalococcoides mccartyi]